MNETERKQIEQMLHEHRQDIAQAWYWTMSQLSPIPLEVSALKPKLEELVEQFIDVMLAEPFAPGKAQEIGSAVEGVDNFQAKDWIVIQSALAGALVECLDTDLRLALYPRLVPALAALSTGAISTKAERMRALDVSGMSKMAHDLKTPINAITGFSRVILKGIDGPITEFQEQDLTSIYEAGQKLLVMINDLFEVAKSSARRAELYPHTFYVSDLLGDVMSTVQPVLAERGHSLEVRAIGELGKMQADASHVRWIILSLLLYASRLADNRTISLTLSREQANDTEWILFEVAEALPDELLNQEELLSKLELEKAEENGDVVLITGQRFCQALGGNLSMGMEEGLAKLSARLPARAKVAE